jgi:hypothetical protein
MGDDAAERIHPAVAVVGDIAIFYGGVLPSGGPLDNHYAISLYNAATNIWDHLMFPDRNNFNCLAGDGCSGEDPSYGSAGVALGHLALFAGGIDGEDTSSYEYINIFNTYTGRWSKPIKMPFALSRVELIRDEEEDAQVTIGASNKRKAIFTNKYVGGSGRSLLVSLPNDRDPILEWSFTLRCGGYTSPLHNPVDSAERPLDTANQSQLKYSFVHVEGVINRNEWECERFTTTLGRETTSCVPSQLVVKPLILKRPLSPNEEFWDWRDQVASGQLAYARDNCELIMYGRDYRPLFAWRIRNAWPGIIFLLYSITYSTQSLFCL